MLYSIGYGNRTLQAFLAIAADYRLTHIVDVRSVPYSNYQVEFRREMLEQSLPTAGYKYVYMGDTLGGSVVRVAGQDPEARRLLDLGIQRLLQALGSTDKRLCLMCGCLLPDKCHRGLPLGRELTGAGLEYAHIGRNAELFTHESLVERAGAQPDLFEAVTLPEDIP